MSCSRQFHRVNTREMPLRKQNKEFYRRISGQCPLHENLSLHLYHAKATTDRLMSTAGQCPLQEDVAAAGSIGNHARIYRYTFTSIPSWIPYLMHAFFSSRLVVQILIEAWSAASLDNGQKSCFGVHIFR